jgi:Na+/proline symporter
MKSHKSAISDANIGWLILVLFYGFGWLINLGMAGGVLIHALTGLPYVYGMSVILTICVLYTLLGGLRAVIGTDFIQTMLILVGVVILACLAIDKVGFDNIHSAVLQERPELLNLLMPAAIMFLFINLLFDVGGDIPLQCLVEPRITTLAVLLYFTGAFVASTIWPIVVELYWKKTNANGATLVMVLCTGIGLYSYFAIGFYVAALIGAVVSMIVVIVTWLSWPDEFEWSQLQYSGANAKGASQ